MSLAEDNMENKIKILTDKLDCDEEQLEMLQEEIDRVVFEHYHLSEHCKEYSKRKNQNEEYFKSQKLDLENLTKHWKELKKERYLLMDSIDITKCKIGAAEFEAELDM